jgi:hypothetical protein
VLRFAPIVRTSLLGCFAAAALSCRGEPAPAAGGGAAVVSASPAPPTPASTPPPTATATPTEAASPPPSMPLARVAALEPSGPAPLARDAETVVDPAASFELELSGRLTDARLVLLDSADAHVAARSTREVGGQTRLTLAPASPLVPGSRYVLRVEGAGTREVRDGERAYAPLSFPLLAAGTPPPPEPKRKAKKRKRR